MKAHLAVHFTDYTFRGNLYLLSRRNGHPLNMNIHNPIRDILYTGGEWFGLLCMLWRVCAGGNDGMPGLLEAVYGKC